MPQESPLDATSACPVAETCTVCGGSNRLHATAYEGEIGVFCCTVCADCVVRGRRPRLAPGPEKLAIVAHCEHLGIGTDEMVLTHHAEQQAAYRRRVYGDHAADRAATTPLKPHGSPAWWRDLYERGPRTPGPNKGA